MKILKMTMVSAGRHRHPAAVGSLHVTTASLAEEDRIRKRHMAVMRFMVDAGRALLH